MSRDIARKVRFEVLLNLNRKLKQRPDPSSSEPSNPNSPARSTGVADGREARDNAIARLESAYSDWIDSATRAVWLAAVEEIEFTTDDVRARARHLGLGEPAEPRAWGAVMRAAIEKHAYCVKTGRYRSSDRAVCHARPIPIYRSLIYGRRR